MAAFSRVLYVGWGDIDANAHMRNTAYLDKSADVRMMYFQAHGFPTSEFERLGVGPVVMKDEIEYYRELRLLDEVSVGLELAGLSVDGARFRLRNVFTRKGGEVSARVTSTGGWLDLRSRRLIVPPDELLSVVQMLDRTDDYQVLPTGQDRHGSA